jgi:small subunit ribosomal protein S1
MGYPFLPEGRLLYTRENISACADAAALRRAEEACSILEGIAILATPDHDLMVRCGGFVGRMPRKEAAIGIAQGTARDVAILSRVGKPVCFTVIGWESSGAEIRPVLSRVRVQEKARQWLAQLEPGHVLPATITHLEPFGAFVDAGCGITSMISTRNISVSRIPHPGERFYCGQDIWAAVLSYDVQSNHLLLTHRELLGTWAQNVSLFTMGMTVPGVVRSTHDYGSFVELTPNLSGLAEQRVPLAPGERVSVLIRSIQPQHMKVKLALIDRLPPAPPAPLRYFLPDGGRMDHWHYAPPGCEKPGSETLFVRRPNQIR